MKSITAITLVLIVSACTGDGSEADPSPEPAMSDSASTPGAAGSDRMNLDALIAEHFPDYRLSTEPEIASRFQLTDGSKPADYYPNWGSGRTWWVWDGDTDRDGKQDRVVLLTSKADPTKDLLVAFHGDGSASRITEPGGWGVEIENGDVLIVAWEKAADRFRWNGAAYTQVE